MKHKVSFYETFNLRLDVRMSIFNYIKNYSDIHLSGFNRIILYDI